jgi:cytochrome c-type biogenesis protein CcmH/NrfG
MRGDGVRQSAGVIHLVIKRFIIQRRFYKVTDVKNPDGRKYARVIARSLFICAVLVISTAALKAEAFEAPGAKKPAAGAPTAAPAGGEVEKIYNEARKAYGSSEPTRVIELTTKAIAADPKSAKSYALRGKARKDMGDVDNAIADVTKAIQIDPKLGEAYALRAQINEINGEMKKADADYAEACKNDFKDACKK